jgi:hypothetical protein
MLLATVAWAHCTSPDPAGALRSEDDVLWVAPAGEPAAAGTREQPLDFPGAMARLAAGDVAREVRLAAGRYTLDAPWAIPAGVSGSADRPLLIRAADGAQVTLDGALELDPASFAPVVDPQERARLAPAAAERVWVANIEDPRTIARLESAVVLGLVVDGTTWFPARFPNAGMAQFEPETVTPEVCPPGIPVGQQGYGVRAGHPPHLEAGRAHGWRGSLAEPRGARARIANDAAQMAGTWEQWEAEIASRPGRHLLTGYIEANWLRATQQFVSADAKTRSVHLARALAYGWAWRKDKPFFVEGLLCELDQPGEWHYDAVEQRLYLLPPDGWGPESEVAVPVAAGALRFDGCEHVEVRGIEVRNVASGPVVHMEGRFNRLTASTLTNCTALGVELRGEHNALLGCDLVDLRGHVNLRGGRRGPGLLESGHNRVENCHLYQRSFVRDGVRVSISGVGQTLRHCLIHNSGTQAVTVSGNDHRIELNELFNIGFEEGDGGAIYAGGDLTGYGVVYRHNFIHHLMHVPGKVERSGIHLDDLQAGSTCIGNVFYKSAGKGIFMNGGAGHRILDNVFVEGFRGVYNVGAGSQKTFDRQTAIDGDPDHDYRGKKEDYVGRVRALLGDGGWRDEPWASRYPRMLEVLEDAGPFGRLWPIRCEVRGNAYLNNQRGDAAIWSRVAPEAAAKSVIAEERVLAAEDFRDLDRLDLAWRAESELPELPFDAIGLRLDEHRDRMPDKGSYRQALKQRFEGIPCMPGTRERVDTAELVEAAPAISRDAVERDR